LDANSFLEELDIFKKLNEKWVTTVFNNHELKIETTWKEKVEKLETLIKEASYPRLATNSNFHHIVAMLKKLLADSNIVVSVKSITSCGMLAQGLKKSFRDSAKMLFPIILSKFKEKKITCIEESKVK
jgi:hypothetical protein